MKKNKKNKGGRPSKKGTISLKKLEELAGYGLTEAQIANVLDIDEVTLFRYKKDPKFCSVLKRGKDKADKEVVKSLYLRATGYEHEETKLFCHEGAIISAKVIKHYAPDPVSMIFWLKNRQRDLWREKQEGDSASSPTIKIFIQNIIKKAGIDEREREPVVSNSESKNRPS